MKKARKEGIPLDYDAEIERIKEDIKKNPFRFECVYCEAQCREMKSLFQHLTGITARRYARIDCHQRKIEEGIPLRRTPKKYLDVAPLRYPWARIVCIDEDYEPGNPDFSIPAAKLVEMEEFHRDKRTREQLNSG